jgi:threonylcarbamoyladenosine tRNA methylthiotransferase MtaB
MGMDGHAMKERTSARWARTEGTYAVKVLGCKVNTYEAEQICRRLDGKGLRPVGPGEGASVVVVHTCAVTSNAVRKSRQAVRRLRERHPGASVVVTGCAAAEELLARLEGVAARIGPRADWLETFQERVLDALPAGGRETPSAGAPAPGFGGQARAFLKIQDGCDLGCTFCIVPRLRRAPRDKPLAAILREARDMVSAGHRELVVTGVSIGLYGRDAGCPGLPEVLDRLAAVPGLRRIRLSSLHPRELTDELLAVWAASPAIMPHVHLPLQAGSDRVLAAMHRGYSAGEFLDAVARARTALPDPAFNTDVIAGFPGESRDDFAETIRVCRAVGFSRMHVFPYSVRPHTRAARLADRVQPAEIRARCRALQSLAGELAAAYRARYAGAAADVLAEAYDPESGTYQGYTERYLPVRFPGPAGLRGRVVRVRLDAGCQSREEWMRGVVVGGQ